MFGMALTRPSMTMQLTSGMDVFAHVCGQKADTSSNYCDNFQPRDKRRFCFFVKCDAIFRLFSWKLPQIRTSKLCKVVRQHTESLVRCMGFVGHLVLFPAVKEL